MAFVYLFYQDQAVALNEEMTGKARNIYIYVKIVSLSVKTHMDSVKEENQYCGQRHMVNIIRWKRGTRVNIV